MGTNEETPALDWATQAYLNLAALNDGASLPQGRATLEAFLEQAPDTVKRVANDVRAGHTCGCRHPNLGLATNRDLLGELTARIEIHGPGLDYRTVQ